MNDHQDIIAQLKHSPIISPKYCDNCGNKHGQEDLQFVGQQEGNFAFHMNCAHCGIVHILKVNPAMHGISIQRLEMPNTDISPAEYQKFAGKPQIAKEEALEVYMDMQGVSSLDQFLKLFE